MYLNSNALKLTYLLAQFLYTHKRLDLQGIGTFLLEGSVLADPEKVKSGKQISAEGISFLNNPKTKEDPELIDFLSVHAGKIKALMSADLNSHLDLAKEFLNIGKPFLFDGIGSLSKLQSGEFSFTPGHIIPQKLSEQTTKEISAEPVIEEPVTDYKNVLYGQKSKNNWKKPLLFISIIAGVALAIWGGYYVYKRTANDATVKKDKEPDNSTIPITDTVLTKPEPENNLVFNNTGKTKFILEEADSLRAIQRYNRLKTFQWDVLMETKDSQTFKLYLLIPVEVADTTRILDSLSRLNGRKVYIEK